MIVSITLRNIAYRMGAMGFLGHPSLRAADGTVGNYGIMDQQAALRWVQVSHGRRLQVGPRWCVWMSRLPAASRN